MHREYKWKEFHRKKYPEIWGKRVIHYGFTEYHNCILEILRAQKGKQVLECGIGIGWPIAISLARKGAEITGVDISEKLLRQCEENSRKEQLLVKCYELDMDKTNLPFEGNSFDKVYSISTSWYLLNIKRALSEMVRVTRNKGKIIFDILDIFHISSLSVYLYNLLRNSTFIQRIKPSQSRHRYRSPFYISAILKDLPVDYISKGYYLFLPVCLPLLGDKADICKYSDTLSYRLADSLLRYFGSKLVYVCKKRQRCKTKN